MGAIIPRGGAFKSGADDYDLIPDAEMVVSSYSPLFRKLFQFMLYYVEYSSLFFTGSRFTKLSPERGGRYLTTMENSPFYHRRMMILLLKLVTFLPFYDRDDAASEIGYSHGCHLSTDNIS